MKEVISEQCLPRMRLQGSVLIGREGTGIRVQDVFSEQVHCVSFVCFWGGLGVGGATEDDGRSEALCHSWYLLADAERRNKYLEVCSLYTCLEKGRSTLGKCLKTVVHLLFFQENIC